MKILENKAHKERLCFICYNWKSANSLAIHANYSNTSNLGCKTSLAVKAASVGNKFRYLRSLYIWFAPFIPFRFLFLLSGVTMDYLLLAGSASPFVLTITNHQWWEGEGSKTEVTKVSCSAPQLTGTELLLYEHLCCSNMLRTKVFAKLITQLLYTYKFVVFETWT